MHVEKSFLSFLLLLSAFTSFAGVSESCDCKVDTAGYASFKNTLTIADVPMQFHVHNEFAVAIGYINSNTPTVVQNLISNNPTVKTIVLLNSGGSDDDDANLQASQLIHNAGLKMFIPSDGEIASGAVDMFLAGVVRVVENGAYIGVHSWSDGQNDASFYPIGHAYHQPYIDYYVNVGFSQSDAEAFYYYTINAAPAAGIHWMSNDEINQYKIRTCTYAAGPNYSVSTSNGSLIADLANATYQWIDCDANTPISNETNQTFTPTANGNYAVIVTENNCSDTSACTPFNLSSGYLEMNAFNIEMYPNPSVNKVNLNLGELAQNTEIKIYTTNGKLVWNKKIKTNIVKINHNLNSGIYLLQVTTEKYHISKKMVVRK